MAKPASVLDGEWTPLCGLEAIGSDDEGTSENWYWYWGLVPEQKSSSVLSATAGSFAVAVEDSTKQDSEE